MCPPCGLTPGPPGQLPAESGRGAGSFVWEDIVCRFEHPLGAFLLLFYENEWETGEMDVRTLVVRDTGPRNFLRGDKAAVPGAGELMGSGEASG